MFESHGGTFKIEIQLVIDEHEVSGFTVFDASENRQNDPNIIEIVTSGPLILKEHGGQVEKSRIIGQITANGNASYQIQSPKKYDYPTGKEGDCLAQANILLRRLETINGQQAISDSLSVDLYIKRKIINVFKSSFKSYNAWLLNIGSSIGLSFLVTLGAHFFGTDLALLIPAFIGTFILSLALVAVLYSWLIRDRMIKKRLQNTDISNQFKRRNVK